jgi:hypothetical protein
MELIVKKNKRKGLKFEFKEVNEDGPDDIDGTCYLCYQHCSYGPELCMSLPDPRKSGDRNFNFMDFCSELEGDIVPIPGSLEKLYGKIIEKEKKDLK